MKSSARISQKIKEVLIPRKIETIRGAIVRTSFLNLLARIFGYLRMVSIAILFGFNYHTDAFFMALSLIGIFLIFVDVFDSLGVPNLVYAREKGEEEFKELAGVLLSFTTMLTVFVGILSVLSFPLISKIAIGFDEKTKESMAMSYFLLIPYLLTNFYFHHFGAVLRSQRRFTAYFLGEFIFSFSNFSITSIALWLYSFPEVLPVSVSISNILATMYMVFVGREFLHLKLYIDDTVKHILRQFSYLIALYGVFHLFVVVDRAFASMLGEKGVSALTYGSALAFALGSVFKLGHMAITALSESRVDLKVLNKFILFSFVISLPATVFLFLFPKVPVSLLFGHGKFEMLDVSLTSEATKFYSISLFFAFIWIILYRAFQVLNYLMPVFFISIFAILLNTFLNYIFVVVYKLGIAGVCLGTFFAYITLCGLSYLVLLKKISHGERAGHAYIGKT